MSVLHTDVEALSSIMTNLSELASAEGGAAAWRIGLDIL